MKVKVGTGIKGIVNQTSAGGGGMTLSGKGSGIKSFRPGYNDVKSLPK